MCSPFCTASFIEFVKCTTIAIQRFPILFNSAFGRLLKSQTFPLVRRPILPNSIEAFSSTSAFSSKSLVKLPSDCTLKYKIKSSIFMFSHYESHMLAFLRNCTLYWTSIRLPKFSFRQNLCFFTVTYTTYYMFMKSLNYFLFDLASFCSPYIWQALT